MKGRKSTLKNSTYVLVSLSLSLLIIFTAVPYWCLTSIVIPEAGIFVPYSTMQQVFLIVFPTCSLLGALTTLHKRKSIEDIFINIAFPLLILIAVRVLQYFPIGLLILGIVCVLVTLYKIYDYLGRYQALNVKRRRRIIYYKCRRNIVYLLVFTVVPLGIYVSYNDSLDRERFKIIYEFTYKRDERIEKPELEMVSEEQWEQLDAEHRMEQMRKLADYECSKLGVEPVDIYANREATESTMGYYADNEDAIYLNVVYLANCSIQEAAHVMAHEMNHRYNYAIIDSLEVLEDAGFNVKTLDYYQDALKLKEADRNYNRDLKNSYETYRDNELEVRARAYADREVEELAEKFGWSKWENESDI